MSNRNVEDEKATQMTDGSPDGEDTEGEYGLFNIDPETYKIAFYLLILVWLVYLLYVGRGWGDYETRLFPTILLAVAIPLILIQLISLQYPDLKEKVVPDQEDEGFVDRETTGVDSRGLRSSKAEKEKHEIYMVVFAALLPVLMYFIGLGWAILVFSFSFMMFFTRDVKRSILVSILVFALIYILFGEVLNVRIYEGQLQFLPDPIDIIKENIGLMDRFL